MDDQNLSLSHIEILRTFRGFVQKKRLSVALYTAELKQGLVIICNC